MEKKEKNGRIRFVKKTAIIWKRKKKMGGSDLLKNCYNMEKKVTIGQIRFVKKLL